MPEVKDILDLMNGPSEEDRALVEKAYNFAAEAHKDHKRFSGEPYLVHLVETAKGPCQARYERQGNCCRPSS